MLLHMIRKQIHIEKSQQARLRKTAAELGISEAELIRRGIDLFLARPQFPSPAIDLSLWESEKKFIAALRRRQRGRKAANWTREELYDRFDR